MLQFCPTVACLLLFTPLIRAADANPSAKALASDFKGKTVFLRQMYVENDLAFDSRGNVAGAATPGPFSLSAIKVEKSHVNNGMLEIQGHRCVLFNAAGNNDPESLRQVRFLPAAKVSIVIDSDPSQPDSLQSLIDKVFAFTLEDALAGKTETQRKSALESFASGGNSSQGLYRLGAGVTAPRIIYSVRPEFPAEVRLNPQSRTCILSLIVNSEGFPEHIRISRSIDSGFDENAIAAVSQYRFVPATYQNHPVAVEIRIEVNFIVQGSHPMFQP